MKKIGFTFLICMIVGSPISLSPSENEVYPIFYRIIIPERSAADDRLYFSIAVPPEASFQDLFGSSFNLKMVLYHKYKHKTPVLFGEPSGKSSFNDILLSPAKWTQGQVKEQIRQENTLSDIAQEEGPFFPKFRYVLMPHNNHFRLVAAKAFAESNLPRAIDATADPVLQGLLDNPTTKISWAKKGGGLLTAGIGSFLIIKSLRKKPQIEPKEDPQKEAKKKEENEILA